MTIQKFLIFLLYYIINDFFLTVLSFVGLTLILTLTLTPLTFLSVIGVNDADKNLKRWRYANAFKIFCWRAQHCCSLKKRSSPKFGNYFLQLVIVTALKFLTLTKLFISLPEKFWFCPNIFLSLPEKFQFCPNLRNLGGTIAMIVLLHVFCNIYFSAFLILFNHLLIIIVGSVVERRDCDRLVSVKNLPMPFYCVLKKDTLRHS